jgi:type 1 glutamine amidotransferase
MNKATMIGCGVLVGALMTGSIWAQQRGGPQGPTAEEIAKMEAAMPAKAAVPPATSRKLLVIDQVGPRGFHHDCIPYWNKALEIMAQKTGAFSVTIAHDVNALSAENLKGFDAVCFNNTVSLPLCPDRTPELCKALMDFVKGGKGVVGIHAATDSYYAQPYVWPEGQEMWGGKFTGHPWTAQGTWAVKIDEPNHPLMASFGGKGFKINDEIYRTEPPLYSRSKQLVLMSLDMSDETTKARSQKPSDADTGISWVKDWGDGRVFYCSLGHVHDVAWTPAVLEHYLRGIQFALGDLKADAKPKAPAEEK